MRTRGRMYGGRNAALALVLVAAAGSIAAAAEVDPAQLDESIRRIRMGTLLIEAPPGAEVRVEQLRHEFWFGAAIASHVFGDRVDADDSARYKQVFLENL